LFERDRRLSTTLVQSIARQGRFTEAGELGEREGIAGYTRVAILAGLHATGLQVPSALEDSGVPDSVVLSIRLLARGVAAVNEDPDRLPEVRSELGRRERRDLEAGDTVAARRYAGLDGALAAYAAWRLENDPAVAVRLLEEARPRVTGRLGSTWFAAANILRMWLGDLYAELDQPETAVRYYRSLLFGDVLPGLAQYRLADMYERLGRPEDARRAYAELVDVWRDADPQAQPLVEDARQRLAALTAEG
jgi:tetratricopeptide (TPR) repeat protein